MIIFNNVSKAYRRGSVEKRVFEGLDLQIPTDKKVAVFGARGSGKTTLLHLLAGLERPTHGKIERFSSVSLPIGYSRTFKPFLSCRDNVSFLARCYGAGVSEVVDFVREVTDIGRAFELPMRLVDTEPRLRVVYALGYALPFDTYLIDNAFAAGDQEFKDRCQAMLIERAKNAGIIFASWDPRVAKRYCESAFLLAGQKLKYFADIEEAAWNLANLSRNAVGAP